MARLGEACEQFIASLEKAHAELDWIAGQLEEEFASRNKVGGVNPLRLVQRIHRLQAEIPALAAEVTDVLTAKSNYVNAAKEQLQANTELLERLQRRAGLDPGKEGGETAAAMASMLAAVQQLETQLGNRG